jgi:hypothetical protein
MSSVEKYHEYSITDVQRILKVNDYIDKMNDRIQESIIIPSFEETQKFIRTNLQRSIIWITRTWLHLAL